MSTCKWVKGLNSQIFRLSDYQNVMTWGLDALATGLKLLKTLSLYRAGIAELQQIAPIGELALRNIIKLTSVIHVM